MRQIKKQATYNYCLDQTPEQRVKSFKKHFNSYVSVISMLWVIWFFTGTGHPWPIYTTIGWGIGLVSHALSTHRFNSIEKHQEQQSKNEFI